MVYMGEGWLTTWAILGGFLLDLLIGDPPWFYHPVRLIGLLISGLEKALRQVLPATRKGERAGGVLLVLGTLLVTGACSWGLIDLARRLGRPAFFLVQLLMTCSLLAARSLREESAKVYQKLETGDLEGARRAVSMIVGRDTDRLTEEGVAKASVETIAENCSDGEIAPLFYLILGGPVLGWLYKAVNTMDSMVGYKNDRYRFFGTAAARLDDLMNFLPARLAGAIMAFCAPAVGLDGRGARRIFLRDRKKHQSPNSGQTEAAMAGALGVQLAGNASYFGKPVRKPTIGDPLRRVEKEDINRANCLMLFTSFVCLVLLLGVRGLVQLAAPIWI